ncbi:MAG TPA: hypothetical protein VHB47_08480 [Thermoanaerobaculia bacterium]|jgi:hypothetical protein|nr:hypothetical protein [Thermoanaerobaculia bacterium]
MNRIDDGIRRRLVVFGVGIVLIFGYPTAASADVGIPMLYLVYPALVLLLLPIILLEALPARTVLGCSLPTALKLSATANALSALVGVPVTWLALLLVEFAAMAIFSLFPQPPRILGEILGFSLGSAWINPVQHEWPIYVAAMVLCVPFYFMSVWVEARVARRVLPSAADEAIRRWSRQANLLSYSLILLGLLAMTGWSLRPLTQPTDDTATTFTDSSSHGTVLRSVPLRMNAAAFSTRITGRRRVGPNLFDVTVNTLAAPPGDPAVRAAFEQARRAITAAAGHPVSIAGPMLLSSKSKAAATALGNVSGVQIRSTRVFKTANGPMTICIGDLGDLASIPSSQPLPPCPPSATRFVVKARTVNYNRNTHTESVLYSALNLTGNLTTAHYELVEQDERSP